MPILIYIYSEVKEYINPSKDLSSYQTKYICRDTAQEEPDKDVNALFSYYEDDIVRNNKRRKYIGMNIPQKCCPSTNKYFLVIHTPTNKRW